MSDVSLGAFGAVVLAGERPGGGALSRELGLPAGVLAPVAGRPAVVRVLETLIASRRVGPIVLCGPARAALDQSAELRALLAESAITWCEPAAGPAASTLAGLERLGRSPALVTSGDHALLEPAIVDDFLSAATARGGDAVVGLVPWPTVRSAFPDTKRTVLRFSDQPCCGSNLIAVLDPAGRAAIEFWRSVEAWRKKPWRIAGHLGWWPLARYLGGRLSRDQGAALLSARAGCRVRWVEVQAARAAVDVDSVADLALAERLLSETRTTCGLGLS